MTISVRGLTNTEVLRRRAKGLGNNVRLQTSRSFWQIISANLLTFTNLLLFAIGGALVILRLYSDAFLSVGLVLMNVIVGVIQEARAKQTLDKIALLTRPKATVIRDGQEQVVDPSEIVVGDILVVGIGDQIVVDGEVIGSGALDVDESLLTGESDLIKKHPGDTVYSGSFVVNGKSTYEAKQVGIESLANKMTAGARAFRQVRTPLQVDVDFAVRILVALAVQLGVLLGLSAIVSRLPITESARIAAVVGGLIPNGLIFMTTVSYGMGAVRMAGRGALVQQFNAVESMSNVNVLCLDKTGTLTANKILFDAAHPIQCDEATLKTQIADFAKNATAGNRTSEAIVTALGGQERKKIDEVPFSSALKWSAAAFDDPAMKGVYALGALEMLAPYLSPGVDCEARIQEWSDRGLRVLVFAHRPEPSPLHDTSGEAQLPHDMIPLGFVTFTDELRAEARETLRKFADIGIALKIISGDNPNTVASLARQAGLPADIKVISGLELDGLDELQLAKVAEETTVFGRITPEQKERLVQTLRKSGHYVAMIGDGVNDVLSLKKAQIGIAMQSGSQATRGVADIVLLNDSFAALPSTFGEGQRILTAMRDIMALFLTRAAYVALIIIGTAVVGVEFPFAPKQVSILTLFTVGIPTIALAAWARPSIPPRDVLRSILHFIIPAAITLAGISIFLYVYYFVTQRDIALAGAMDNIIRGTAAYRTVVRDATEIGRTVITSFTILCGLFLIVFVEPPTEFWAGGEKLSGDWRPTLLALAMGIAFALMTLIPDARNFLELRLLQPKDYLIIAALALIWALVVRAIWRSAIFNRFLGLVPSLDRS